LPRVARRWATCWLLNPSRERSSSKAPGFFVGEYMSTQHYKRLEDRERHRTALLGRLAGVNVTTWHRRA
jgi:hypothetical protein